MESLHVRLETSEAINAKKQLLSTEINFLNMLKKLEEYKNLRERELNEKKILKTKLKEMIIGMTDLQNQLPRTRLKKEERRKVKIESIGKTRKNELEKELREIKEKLAKLG